MGLRKRKEREAKKEEESEVKKECMPFYAILYRYLRPLIRQEQVFNCSVLPLSRRMKEENEEEEKRKKERKAKEKEEQ